jgi:protein-tyrosine-phosphatase
MSSQELLLICSGEHSFGQMLAGYLGFYSGKKFNSTVVTLENRGLHPLAIQVMKEDGIDIASARNILMQQIPSRRYDLLINLTGETFQLPNNTTVLEIADISISYNDSYSAFEDILQQFRNIREEIKVFAIETAGKYSAAQL